MVFMSGFQFAAVAAQCVQYEPGFRPNMTTVRKRLERLLKEKVGSSSSNPLKVDWGRTEKETREHSLCRFKFQLQTRDCPINLLESDPSITRSINFKHDSVIELPMFWDHYLELPFLLILSLRSHSHHSGLHRNAPPRCRGAPDTGQKFWRAHLQYS